MMELKKYVDEVSQWLDARAKCYENVLTSTTKAAFSYVVIYIPSTVYSMYAHSSAK